MNSFEKIRYARQIIIPEIGEKGQENIIKSSVLVIGAGGLGSSTILYIVAGGIGKIGVIDNDKVEETNLQRQIIHEESDIGVNKAESAVEKIKAINSQCKTDLYKERLTEDNAENIIKNYDIIVDGSDNIGTRFLVNRMCKKLKKKLVTAAILKFEGQITCFDFSNDDSPCYNCIYDEEIPSSVMPDCSTNGIFAPIAGVLGSMQANQTLKIAAGDIGYIYNQMIIFNGLSNSFRKVSINKDKKCSVCS